MVLVMPLIWLEEAEISAMAVVRALILLLHTLSCSLASTEYFRASAASSEVRATWPEMS